MNTTHNKDISKRKVNQAGKNLLDKTHSNYEEAKRVLDIWRALHIEPLNRFQISLRKKLVKIDEKSLVSQRLKRAPSILAKLERNPTMELARMQDIGGIRAVTQNMQKLRLLESVYKKGTRVFTVQSRKDYIINPKKSGYRSVHLIFKYKNGFSIELQMRTKIQHAWATAVETMGTFLNHSLKSSEGPDEWLNFFSLASSAFAVVESTPRISEHSHLSDKETFHKLLEMEKALDVTKKLNGFRIVTRHISQDKNKGKYYLITLDLDNRKANIRRYNEKNIDDANAMYSIKESEIRSGKNIQAVLVSSESINSLKKAYPSYFLDAELFTKQINIIRSKFEKM